MELPLHVLCDKLNIPFENVYSEFKGKDEAIFSKLLTRAVKVVHAMIAAGIEFKDPRIVVLDKSLIIEYDDCYKNLVFEADRDTVALEIYRDSILKTLSFNPASPTSLETFIKLAKTLLGG